MDIVPAGDGMLVEVKVNPNEIEHVKVGLKSHVRLTAYKQHRVPTIEGRLTYVSADKLTDDRGEAYILARVTLLPESLHALKGVVMTPGMPAEVIVVGGERRAIDYFISPFSDSLRRAFREE